MSARTIGDDAFARRVLVTGATGGLGRQAVDELLARGQPLRATGRDPARGAAVAQAGAAFVPCELAALSPTEADALLHDVDVVWHCAALSSPWGRLADFHAANVEATTRLARAAAERGVRRFVHVSTPSIYFDWRHRRDVPESHRAARPVNHYARTKGEAEDAIRELARRWPATTFTMLRPRAIFGPHDRVLLPRVMRVAAARGGELPLPRGGAAHVDLTYVGNVVHAMVLASRREGLLSGDAFNVTNHEPGALGDWLLRLLRDGMCLPLRVRTLSWPLLRAAAAGLEAWGGASGREPAFTRYSAAMLHYDTTLASAHARDALGYTPIVNMAQALRLTADWHLRHGHAH